MTLRERVETTRGEAALAHLALTLLDELEAAVRDRERLRAALRDARDALAETQAPLVSPPGVADRREALGRVHRAMADVVAALRDTAP